MAYATASDIEIIYGSSILDAVSDRDGTGRRNTASIEAALDAASAEIDTYLGIRYTVPLASAPPYIRQICVDITVYRLALDIAPRTEEMRLRYVDAINYLKAIADGKINLPVVSDGSGEPGDGGSSVGVGASVFGARRG